MSSTESSQPSPSENSEIETIYTTASTQTEPTDWLTVVRNLRLSNRRLLQQITDLEMSLSESQNNLIKQQEENEIQSLTIQQQQEDLKLATERLTNLFNQLETSHQIGQKQQILIETLSQQLEIAQDYIAELESENQKIKEDYNIQAQELNQTKSLAKKLNNLIENKQVNNPLVIPEKLTQATSSTSLGEPLNKILTSNTEKSIELPPLSPTRTSPLPLTTKSRQKPPAPKISEQPSSNANNSSIQLPKFGRQED